LPARLDATRPGFARAFARLVSAKREMEADVDDVVRKIIADVRRRGDGAVAQYTAKFDRLKVAPGAFGISRAAIRAGAAKAPQEARRALLRAAERIRAYHSRQKPKDAFWTDKAGVRLGWRWTALSSVGLYVPGGRAAYPSSFLMNAIPALVAGVERVAVVMPTPGGEVDPLLLAAADILGLEEIYAVGGAQAVAALAFGTESIAAVDKIVGPGNAYVAAAKRRVFGHVGIDSIAGPSEILVVADAANDPARIAADLLSQAEHDEASQAVLIVDDAAFGARVGRAVDALLRNLPRRAIAAKSWRDNGAIIRVRRLDDAPPLIDRIAPEHLELCVARPDAFARRVRHAGAIFLGREVPEAIGDYVGGPNHVLPTARTARFSSGLSVLDFMKRTSLLGLDARSLARIGPDAVTLARAEGLEAHALSVAGRLTRGR
jgi:histidinol dehydrogenase